jgi:beta-lactamase regulating signal transducer with metallopeptidase domain
MISLDSVLVGLVARGLWTALTVLATKGVILFVIAYGATRLISSLSATRRHTLWLLVLVMLAVLPVAQLLLPVVHIPFLQSDGFSPVARAASFPFDYQQSATAATAASSISVGGTAGGAPIRWLPPLLAGTWALVALILAGRPIMARIALGRLARSANYPAAPASLLNALADRIGVRRAILLDHPQVEIPFAFGIFNPRVVLPQSWHAWSSRRLKAVLMHELSHIKRRDALSNAAAHMLCALLWFNPLMWIARALMLREAEVCCDLEVLTNGIKGPEYALTILEILRRARGPYFVRSSACTLGRRRMLKERIRHILFPEALAQRAASFIRGRILMLGFCVLLPLFAVSISLRGPEKLYGAWQRQVEPKPARDLFDQDQYRWNVDGTGQRSFAILPDIPAATCVYTIEKEWTDPQGYTWYNLKATWTGIPAPLYTLIRLHPSGNFYDVTDSLTGYPRQFDGPLGDEKHKLYWRL